MQSWKWQEEKEEREKVALEEHTRLHRLFVEDRLSFERERKKLIDEVINRADTEEEKQRLWDLQKKWDKRMRGAGSKYNRFVLAQHFFWEHFHGTWHPTIKKFNALLNPADGKEG